MARNTRWFQVAQKSDTAADDSDKTFTVPAATSWRLLSVYAKLVSDATVGNRQLDVLVTDASDNELAKFVAGAVQAASLTRTYLFAPQHPQETAFTNALMLRALAGDLVLPAGFKVRIFDSAAIAAATDDLTLRLLVEELVE